MGEGLESAREGRDLAGLLLPEVTQRCPGCKEYKSEAEYNPSSWGKRGNACRTCTSARWKARYVADPSQFQTSNKRWVKENRARLTANNREWRNNNLGRHFCHTISQRAKNLGLAYELTPAFFDPFPPNCTYCGRELKINYGKRQDNSPSVDRLEPEQGYTIKNSVVCCWNCNRRKQEAGAVALMTLANDVMRIAKQRGLICE